MLDTYEIDEFLVVGGLILEPKLIPEVRLVLRPEHFTKVVHTIVYESILRCEGTLHGRSDWTVVQQDLRERGRISDVPQDFFERICNETVNPSMAPYHAGIVVKAHRLRTLHNACDSIMREIQRQETMPDTELRENYQRLLRAIMDTAGMAQVRPMRDMMMALDLVGKGPNDDPNYPRTRIPDIDDLADLFPPGELTVLAARPAMGKTTFLRQMLRATSDVCHTAFFTMEESPDVILRKMLCTEARASYRQLTAFGRNVPQEILTRLVMVQEAVASLSVDFVGDTLSPEDVSAHIARMGAMGRPPRVAFIDHLQHMRHERIKGETDAAMYGRAIHTLKEAAKTNGCTVVLACQLNREVERRQEPRPMMADLRDSGTVEQVATNVAFLWSRNPDGNERTFYLCKSRHGPPFQTDLVFMREFGLFGAISRVRETP